MTADQPNPQAVSDAPRYEVPTDLAWIDGSEHGHEGDLYLTKVPDGKTVLLRGSSRLIWLAAIESANPLAEIAASVRGLVSRREPVRPGVGVTDKGLQDE